MKSNDRTREATSMVQEILQQSGFDPGSDQNYLRELSFQKAKGIAGARTKSKRDTKTENYSRLRSAMTI